MSKDPKNNESIENQIANTKELDVVDLEKKIKKSLLGRLTHPFIGTFIFSFLTYNYKLVLILIFGLLDKYSYYDTVIEDFSKHIGFCKDTVFVPICFAIFVPLVLQNFGDFLIEKSKAYTAKRIANSIEKEKKKELIYRVKSLTSELQKQIDKYNKQIELQNQFLQNAISLLNEKYSNGGNSNVAVYESKETLSSNMFVSLDTRQQLICGYSKHLSFYGIILEKSQLSIMQLKNYQIMN
ncbi:hypothetical protein ND860_18720 [Leptospira levettii]|uniref:hypothetical protein n=1 Tax=Leptospira levettii TaxID=2023178 RepID=UPI00223CC322|nr:hypothetical protein [Leptospira levettii]MCW7498576.1 hypothetical protein [Leptospira levettii]